MDPSYLPIRNIFNIFILYNPQYILHPIGQTIMLSPLTREVFYYKNELEKSKLFSKPEILSMKTM